jgi:hypothetical protein
MVWIAVRSSRRATGLTARLVASYEDPTIRNYVVDLRRYPGLKRSLQSGQTVFVADVQSDPAMKHVHDLMEKRGAKTITVVPIAWRTVVIGAIFLRTFRDGTAFTDADLRFVRLSAPSQPECCATPMVINSSWSDRLKAASGLGVPTSSTWRWWNSSSGFSIPLRGMVTRGMKTCYPKRPEKNSIDWQTSSGLIREEGKGR